MPEIKNTNRPQSCLVLLKQAVTRLQEEQASGRFTLTDSRLAALPDLINRLDAAFIAREAASQRRNETLKARRERVTVLYKVITHFQDATLNRASRLPQGDRLRTLFQFLPKLTRQARADYRLLLALAQSIAEAEAQALAAGFEPSVNPGLDEVNALASDAASLFNEDERAIHDLKQAQVALRQVQTEVGPALKRLRDHLHLATDDYAKPVQRQILRSFGFRYKSDPDSQPGSGQAQDPDSPASTEGTPTGEEGRDRSSGTGQNRSAKTAVA